MNRQRSSTVWRVVLIAGSATILAAIVLLISLRISAMKATREIRYGLPEVDALIEDGTFDRAGARLLRLSSSARSASDWLRLLKRGKAVAGAGGGNKLMFTLAERSVKAFPGNEELWALAVYAALRSDNSDVAAEWAAAHLSGPSYTSMKAEAFLRTGQTLEKDGAQDGAGMLTRLADSSNPDEFGQAATLTGDPRFTADQVILLARKGRFGAAWDALHDPRVQERFPVLSAYVAYDFGMFERAEKLLSLVPAEDSAVASALLLESDIAMLREEYEKALKIYQELSASNPGLTPVLFLNLAWLSTQKDAGNPAAGEILSRGLEHFPDNGDLVQALVLVSGGADSPRARTLLRNFVQEHPQDIKAALLERRVFGREIPVQAEAAHLWMLYNEHPDSEEAARYLAWFSSSTRNRTDLRRILDRSAGDSAWGKVYAAKEAFADGNIENAQTLLQDASSEPGLWEASYDLGLLHLSRGKVGPARESFEAAKKAALALVPRSRSKTARALCEWRIAESYAAVDGFDSAWTHLQAALELDPGNTEIRAFKQRLELSGRG